MYRNVNKCLNSGRKYSPYSMILKWISPISVCSTAKEVIPPPRGPAKENEIQPELSIKLV